MKGIPAHGRLGRMTRLGFRARGRGAKAGKGCLILLCLLLAGCGTNLNKLLRDDGRLYWQADQILRIAEPLELGLDDAAYAAEAAQNQACRVIYRGVMEKAFGERRRSVFERLWSSLKQVFVALVPIGPVEGCARAQETYRKEIKILCRKLKAMSKPVDCLR